ncbi:MAG: MBL fold metallo-hydrolase [Desulfuromonas sp.]|nr:MAG: MBL fold metallo-hydrolase [Desulfuromonas sp.]
MLIEDLAVGPLQVNAFVIAAAAGGEAIVVDPGEDGEIILKALERHNLTLKLIVNTHGHFDHIGANRFLVEKTGADLALHEADQELLSRAGEHAARYGLQTVASPDPTRLLADGDTVSVGGLTFEVMHTPGHTPGGICLYGDGHLFAGDTLFAGSIGRTDLPGGDHRTLIQGIRRRLMVLPAETVVHPGHGPDTTIGREKRINPFVGDGA